MNENSRQSFTDLEVWKKARVFKNDIKELTKSFPGEEKFSLTDQIIRSSRGVNATIAEGHGRYTFKDQPHFCIISRGSLSETYNHLIDALDCKYISQIQLDADKTYEAVLLLGLKTTTGDAEGDVIETRPVPEITPELLEKLTLQFTGPIAQIPPMYSALKKDGKALYEYARKGEEVEREARHIVIYQLKMAVDQDNRAQAAIKIIVRCSKGTYIRTLGEDIGEAMGCGAHLGSLRRLETGGYTVDQCISLPELEAMDEASRDARLLPPQSLVASYPSVTLDADNAGRFLSGLRRRGTPGQWGANAPLVQVFGSDPIAFLGSAHITADELIPQRLLSPIEVQDMLQSASH